MVFLLPQTLVKTLAKKTFHNLTDNLPNTSLKLSNKNRDVKQISQIQYNDAQVSKTTWDALP